MDWIAAPIAAGAVIAWLAVVVLVHHDQGDVGVSDADRLRLRLIGAVTKFTLVVGDELVPAMRRMAEQIKRVNEALAKHRRAA